MSGTNEGTHSSPEPNAGAQSKENPEFIKIDPACIRDALRMYFQPIKNDDPVLDFYTMYKRETMEYDTEYMNKYNEDLNTTLIFAGLFSAVSSAFVIAFQPGLQQDPSDRSEAYLRAILLSINPSISPDEHPTPTSTWNGPPQEIVTTLNLLYASLLMSLLAAFVAMLGKQWLNRYLRHTGGSMIERCGDRQRKFDGIEKWPFRAFIESLPMMLQIALFLLTSGLSRYMWSINGSVARVIVYFTLLSFFFYIGIVVAGTSSYECPLQTPVSDALRALKDSGVAGRIVTRVSSSTYALSPVVLDNIRKFRQAIRMFTRAAPLPAAVGNMDGPPPAPQDSTGLRIKVRDLEGIQKQNMANGRCVCWVLRNMTDPEAIDCAIFLAGIIRWFDGGLDQDPPFDTIVSFFMACFDSAKQLYPSMRDRAYFSARAILQIHVRARGQPYERARRYPIPAAPSGLLPHADNDLHNLLDLFATLRDPSQVLDLPDMSIHTPVHSSWVSSLFVDLLSVSPNLPLFRDPYWHAARPGRGYVSAATAHHRVVIANTLLMVDISLGGHIEGETFWAADKSDSLETIFSHLSTTVMKAITENNRSSCLEFLLWFLVAWEKRPDWLAPFAFRWCCVVLGRPSIPPSYISRLASPSVQLTTTELLVRALEIGFRSIHLDYRSDPIAHPDYTSHFNQIFRIAASGGDEVIADALHAWIAHRDHTSHCPLEILFHERKGVDEPFSPRLRRVSIRAIEHIWIKEFRVSAVLLKLLDVKPGEMDMARYDWWKLILSVARSSSDSSLPLHHWRLLADLARDEELSGKFEDPCDVKTMKLLEKNEEWEKLEMWMGVIWQHLERPVVTLVEDVERVTLKLLLRRPSAIPRFQELSTRIGDSPTYLDRKLLELMCALARARSVPSATGFLPAPPPSPGAVQTTKSIEASPGSSATAHRISNYDFVPRGFCEEESGNGSGGTDDGSGGEGDRPLGSTSVTTHTAISPANQGATPSPSATGEQLMSYDSEQPHSGPTITTTLPARAVPNRPPPVENHPNDSTRCHPPIASSYISTPREGKQSILASDKVVQNDESQKTTPEREYVQEFWLGRGRQERQNLVGEDRDEALAKMLSRHNCGCQACHVRWHIIEKELPLQCYAYYESPERWVDNILCMLLQPHGPQLPVQSVELDENVSQPGLHPPLRPEPGSSNPIITFALDGMDSNVGLGKPESELGHRSEAARAGSEGGGLSGFGDNNKIPDSTLTAANYPPRKNRQEVLEEFVKAMADRRIIIESAGRSNNHRFDRSQLESQLKAVFSIFVPRLLSLRLLEVLQEQRRVLLERQQVYRRWLQELIDEDERAAVKE